MKVAAFAAAVSVLLPLAAIAQSPGPPTGKCQFEIDPNPKGTLNLIKLPSGKYNNYLGGGVVARCRTQRIVLKADSLEQYGDEGRSYFIGHVDYSEPRLRLKSDFLTYFKNEERLLAVLNVDATLPTGSKLKGSSLEFFRAIPKIRPQQRGIALGRPTMSIIEKDAQGKEQLPVTVTGNTIWLERDSVVSSSGDVVVVRPELTATGDSIHLDGGSGLLRIMRRPKIVGTKGRPFTLVGETIDLLTKRKKLERVYATVEAQAVSDDITLKSDTIDLRVTNDQLQRAIAWGKNRARATSPSQTIVSDSLDVLMPGQRIREIHALRGASAEGTPDTARFKTAERDRITGDTIVAHFDSIPARDTVSKPRIRQLVATGHATSLQHLAPQDSSCHVPAINYVRGRIITVNLDAAKIKNVEVVEKDETAGGGAFLEPGAGCGRDSLNTKAGQKAGQTPVPARTPAGGRPPSGTPPASSSPASPTARMREGL